jgi:hypothetical protein
MVADTRAASSTLSYFKDSAANSPQAMQLKQHTQMMAYATAPVIQRAMTQRELTRAVAGLLPAQAFQFAKLTKWENANLTALAAQFIVNNNEKTAADWVEIGNAFVNRESFVVSLAGLTTWSVGNLKDLASFVATDFGKLDACLIYAKELINRPKDVKAFVQIAGWNGEQLKVLLTQFKASNRNIDVWKGLASVLIDKPLEIKEFATCTGWDAIELTALATLFTTATVQRPIEKWVEIAKVCKNRPDKQLEVNALIHIPARTDEYLATLTAGIAQLGAKRSARDMITLADVALNLTAADVIQLLQAPPTGMPATFDTADIITLRTTAPGLTTQQYIDIGAALKPLKIGAAVKLLTLLQNDGCTNLAIHGMLKRLCEAGQTGSQIASSIEALRGTDLAGAAGINIVGGTLALDGPMMADQVSRLSPIRKPDTLGHYPTGHKPADRSPEQLWEDVRLAVPLKYPGTTRDDTPAERIIRQRLALQRLTTLPGANREIVQQLFHEHDGAYPRLVGTAAEEDVLGTGAAAHTNDRHVLGGSDETINNETALARRVLRHIRGACPGNASAFSAPDNAKAGMKAGLNNKFGAAAPAGAAPPHAGWVAARASILKGETLNYDVIVGGIVGKIMTPNFSAPPYDNAGSQTMSDTAMPMYSANVALGGRPYWATDPAFDAAMRPHLATIAGPRRVSKRRNTPPYTDYEPGTGLATLNAAPTGVHLRMISGNVSGGWFIHSAWPT